jgi:hypothetical protein
MKTKKPKMAKITVKALNDLKSCKAKVVKYNRAAIQKIKNLRQEIEQLKQVEPIPELPKGFDPASLPQIEVYIEESTGKLRCKSNARIIVNTVTPKYGLGGKRSSGLIAADMYELVKNKLPLVYVDLSSNCYILLTNAEAIENLVGYSQCGQYARIVISDALIKNAKPISRVPGPVVEPPPSEIKGSTFRRFFKKFGV